MCNRNYAEKFMALLYLSSIRDIKEKTKVYLDYMDTIDYSCRPVI